MSVVFLPSEEEQTRTVVPASPFPAGEPELERAIDHFQRNQNDPEHGPWFRWLAEQLDELRKWRGALGSLVAKYREDADGETDGKKGEAG